MGLLDRLLRRPDAAREALRPLWFSTVIAARDPVWYRDLGVADTIEGRFDMITLVLSLVMLRLEREPDTAEAAARLTELFVEDMDGQLRQEGVGDLMVGKHIGKLMATLGGRLGALREAVPLGADAVAGVIGRNATLVPGSDPRPLATALLKLHTSWLAIPRDEVLGGRLKQ